MHIRLFAALAAPLLLAGIPAQAQEIASLPPAIPWSGKSEALIVPATDPWISPAERSGFETTPSYGETRAWLEKLAGASPLLSIETFGRTPEGRDMIYVRASKGGTGKPVVLAQAGIHAGEIDGKDAGLMLLRDIALRGKDALLDHVDFVFVPILNIDGHERSGIWARPNQRGPREKGWRTTAQNINLNRDYAKADAPEARAILRLFRQLDPALYIDLHVSDGIDHQYDVTYAFAGWGIYARSHRITHWLQTRFAPAIEDALTRAGHIPGVYPSELDGRDLSKGIRFSPEGPRYSTGYGDFARVPTVLVENHTLKPYRQRVLGTYVLLEAALRLVGREGEQIASAKAADRATRPTELMTRWKPANKPIATRDFKGVAHDTYRSPASGREEVRWLGRPTRMRVPVIGYVATQTVRLPKAWWVPVSEIEVIDRLRLHGIQFEAIAAPRTLELDRVRLVAPKLKAPSEGRVPLSADYQHERRRETMPAGSLRVPADQPLVLLAAALLEPESEDSLLAWGFFPHILGRIEDMEDYALAPLADRMLASDPELRAAFEQRLAADPAFAADGEARLAWFYERTPYADPRYLMYPVARELE
jgi:murein tripeptide amidase MpaA